MSEQVITVTRSMSTMKPRVTDADLPWFRCSSDGRVFLGVGSDEPATVSDNWRSQINELPYRDFGDEACQDGALHRLKPNPDAQAWIDYSFVGGFNNNALCVSWGSDDPDDTLLWVAVKTFTGFQVKYLTAKKQPPLIFAFADEDAYCYCDYTPCKECVFRCKNGFAIQAFFTRSGMIECHCDRMDDAYSSDRLKG